ncbi:hypothetical protein AAC03nite_26480 [Alicyclobacillus acidoterrestris]|nr:hypothetical protein AAC03nite_26480 [Alicyclobacillus acidoterrestris]
MAKRRMSKADKWLMGLAEISARFGVALAEVYDGARLLDDKTGRVVGTNLTYICGLYTAHKPRTSKETQREPSRQEDVQGFLSALNRLSDEFGVVLEVRSSPMMLMDSETMEPLARLSSTEDGYSVQQLQPA